MYYGNAAAADGQDADGLWSADHRAVYHMATTADSEFYPWASPLTLENGALFGTGGIVGDALYAGSSPDRHASVESDSLWSAPSGTVELWFRLDNSFNSATQPTVVLMTRHKDDNDNHQLVLCGNDYPTAARGRIEARMESSSTELEILSGTSTWVGGVWYHVVFAHDGANMANSKLYVNGLVSESSRSSSGPAKGIGFAAEWGLGGGLVESSGGTAVFRKFPGRIDEVRSVHRVLSAAEVDARYDAVVSGAFLQIGAIEVKP